MFLFFIVFSLYIFRSRNRFGTYLPLRVFCQRRETSQRTKTCAVNSRIKSEIRLKYNCLNSLSWSCCCDVSLRFLSWAISPKRSKKDQTTKMSNTDYPPPGSSVLHHGNCQNARVEVMVDGFGWDVLGLSSSWILKNIWKISWLNTPMIRHGT